MDSSFRDRQGYYSNERHQQTQQQQQHQQQHQLSQQQQLLPQYAHQLSHHQALLPPHLQAQHQLHHSQAAFMLADQAREEYGGRHSGPAVLQQLIPGSGQVITSPLHRVHPNQFSEHSHPQLPGQLDPSSHGGFGPAQTGPDQSAGINLDAVSSSSQSFVSPDSPDAHRTQSEDPAEDVVTVTIGGGGEMEGAQPVTVNSQTQPVQRIVQLPAPITEVDTPKKRAVRLALAATNNSLLGLKSTAPFVPAIVPDIWKPDLPIGLSFKYSADGKRIAGVRNERSLQKGTKFGPFNGKLVDEAVGSVKDSTWEVCLRGKVFLYIDGQSKSHNNWMAFVECANNEEQQNMEAFQCYGDIFFRATKVIDPGSELRVFYSEEYANHMGFTMKLSEVVKTETGGFSCSSCKDSQPSAKRLLRHVKLSHCPDRSNELKPVLAWEPRFPVENHTENVEPKKTAVKEPLAISPPRPMPPTKLAKMRTSPKVALPERIVLPPRLRSVNERFICTTCGKNFPTRGRLAAHETFHEYSTEHTCPICQETFSNSNTLAKHMTSHKTKPFKCESCGNAFTTKNMLSRHERLSHSYNHQCRVCGMQFVKKRECNRHEKLHPDWKKYKPSRSSLWRERRRSKETYSAEELPEVGSEMVIMDGDGGWDDDPNLSPNKDMLGKRVNYYDRPRPYKCHFCPKRYLSRKAQQDHESERHTKQCRYRCTHCPSVFATEIRYIEHVKRHVENRPFQCQLCPNAFASANALKNHQGEHTGLKPVKCDICSKGFRTRHFMTAHKRRMHKVQQMRFVCSICNKPFSDKGNLVKHERRHKGIRPYVCLICGRGFTSNYCLVSHSYTHTKEKNFKCPHCDQKFTLNQHLTNHIYKDHTSGAAKTSQEQMQDAAPQDEVEPVHEIESSSDLQMNADLE